MRPLEPDVAIVVAFGQIFPRGSCSTCRGTAASTSTPAAAALARRLGRFRLRWRPAISVTGLTTMQMGRGASPESMRVPGRDRVGPRDRRACLAVRLAVDRREAGGAHLELAGSRRPHPREQRHEEATYAPRLTRESGRADWGLQADELSRRLRAYTPGPASPPSCAADPVKLHRSRAAPARERSGRGARHRARPARRAARRGLRRRHRARHRPNCSAPAARRSGGGRFQERSGCRAGEAFA